jgi:uncharacterized pyridoxamine 5'-phosphate oxidase family protein
MKEVVDFLNANRVGCLGSVEDGRPRVRPFQFQFEADGKLCFCTASDKPVSAQLKANP